MKFRKAATIKKAVTPSAMRKPRITAKTQHILMLTALLVAIGLVVFVEIVRPNQDAKSYTHRLDVASRPLEDCFSKLADTTDLKIFYAPDVSAIVKATDTMTMLKQITTCREEIKKFDQSAHQLLALRFAGYTSTYREATVSQRQAFDLIGQSNDVLDQYQSMATFLADYYKHVEAFLSYTSALDADATYFGTARLKTLSDQANDLRTRSVYIQQMVAPAEFEPTKNATSAMFAMTADGFDKLVSGYTSNDDYMISTGYASIEQATVSYDSTVSNLPFDQLNASYIPQQVKQLPAKVDNLLATSSE